MIRRLSFLAAFILAALVVPVTAWAQYLGTSSVSGGGGSGGGGGAYSAYRAVSAGDSISLYPLHYASFPRVYADANERMTMDSYATSGYTTSQILSTEWPSIDGGGFDLLVINGGTNDCVTATSPATAASIAAAAQANLQTIATDASQQGTSVIVVNIPPIKGWGGWTADIQTCIDTYNTNHLSMTGVRCFADSYAALDLDSDDDIDVAFDNGDGIHPNAAGADAISDAIIATCGLLSPSPISNDAIASLADGNALQPSLSWSNDSDSGFYLVSPGTVGVTIDGANALSANQFGLGVGVAPASGIRLHVYGYGPGGTTNGYFQNAAASGAENVYVGEDIASSYNHGSVLWHGSTAAIYTGWSASQFGLRTGASGGMMLDSYNAGPIKARVNAIDMLNVTATEFEVGSIATSGTPMMFRPSGAAASSGITLPTCDVNAQFDILPVDDTNDSAAAMLCWCRRGSDDSTYAWVSVHDNSTACIDP